MEVIRNYPELEEIIGVIKRIADNLDEMTRIMQIKNPITMTPEKAKSVLNSMYGVMAARPLPDHDPEILRDEMQDLKLENDRLAKRDDKMLQVIRAIACDPDCEFCLLRGSECSGIDMQHLAAQTLKELEEL